MAREIINVGTSPNDGAGDPIRTAFQKTTANFAGLYNLPQTQPPASSVGAPGDVAGMYAYSSGFFYWCYANYDGTSFIWSRVSGSSF